MRALILALFIGYYGVSISVQQYPIDTSLCNVQSDVTHDYRAATYDFTVLLFKAIAIRGKLNFVFSSNSIWINLAAIAEGAEPVTQQKLFTILNLPEDPCVRQKYYELATSRAIPDIDVNIKNNRILMVDEGVTLNPLWYELVLRNSLLEVLRAPIRYNPIATANQINQIMSARLQKLNLNGNSVILDSMDYNGLWTTAFADASIERAPFYDLRGQQVGAVDMMRVKRRARMGYLKTLHAKIIELPIGVDERYRLLFCVPLANADLKPVLVAVTKEIIFEAFTTLRSSYVPLDVAIPRMVVTTEVDVRAILEDLGITELWKDPAITRYISDPPAFPSSYVQRTTLVLNDAGVFLPQQEPNSTYSTRTGLEPILGRDFIADRPFLYGLFDAETNSCLLTAAYSVLTAPIRQNPALTLNEIKRLMSTHAHIAKLDLNGNSILLDSVDYDGLWTTAFADAIVERSPFYKQGYQIGYVDLMRVKRKARMGHLKSLNVKVLEVPVGLNERYRMLFSMLIDPYDSVTSSKLNAMNVDIVFEMFNSLRESDVMLEVAIPRVMMTSEIDVRTLLEDMGVTNLWNDPEASRFVSYPPELPSGFLQRVTLTLNKHGISSAPEYAPAPYSTATGLDPVLGTDFIAIRPFFFALYDTETLTYLLAAAYRDPTYKY